MAMELLDGFRANVSIKTQDYSAGVLTGTPIEHACWATSLSIAFRQDVAYLPKLPFCATPGWKVKAAGERDAVVTMGGLISKGDPSSMPGKYHHGAQFALTAVVDDPTTGSAGSDVNSITGDFIANDDLLGIISKGNSSRAFSAESTGPITKAWVIA